MTDMPPKLEHAWSGWPDAWCQRCGIEDVREECCAKGCCFADCPTGPCVACCFTGVVVVECREHVNPLCFVPVKD